MECSAPFSGTPNVDSSPSLHHHSRRATVLDPADFATFKCRISLLLNSFLIVSFFNSISDLYLIIKVTLHARMRSTLRREASLWYPMHARTCCARVPTTTNSDHESAKCRALRGGQKPSGAREWSLR